eukprot:6636954-Alexandrium_andersonii.AAC.1
MHPHGWWPARNREACNGPRSHGAWAMSTAWQHRWSGELQRKANRAAARREATPGKRRLLHAWGTLAEGTERTRWCVRGVQVE